MRDCPHTRTEVRETTSMYPDWDTGEHVVTEETVEVCTTVDVDLHRYKCTQCGKIMYYSGAARAYHEDGVRAPGIDGLEKP